MLSHFFIDVPSFSVIDFYVYIFFNDFYYGEFRSIDRLYRVAAKLILNINISFCLSIDLILNL